MKKYVLALIMIVTPVVIFYSQTNDESVPPVFSVASDLYKGQISSGGLLNFEDSEKQVSATVTRNPGDTVITKVGINFYHVEKDLILADLLDYSKCINANVNSLIFFTYSPGGETGMFQKGFYIYPPDLADNSKSFGINDKNKFTIEKGRVFGLYTENEAVNSCFRDSVTVSLVDLTDVVKSSNSGWLQIPSKSLKLSETLNPIKNCLESVWIQNSANGFAKIAIADIENYSLQSFVILWLQIKECKDDVLPVADPVTVPEKAPPEVPVDDGGDAVADDEEDPKADSNDDTVPDPETEPEPEPDTTPPVLETVNVKDAPFLAKGDGETDDGSAIQKALDYITGLPGGGKVFIPQGTYFIDTTLLVDDNTEIYGEGEKTVLMRGNKYVLRPSYEDLVLPLLDGNTGYTPETDKDTSCKSAKSLTSVVSKELFSNKHYNCGNRNIHFHDFAIDGSKIVVSTDAKINIYNPDGSLNYNGANPKQNMGTFSLSGMENLLIEHLKIRNTPQDAIFIRNGGVNTIIRDNLIDGFNMLWHNGGGINVEVHPNGHFHVTADKPVLIEQNHIIARGPNFCYGNGHAQCTSDPQCSDYSFVGTAKTDKTPDTSLFCELGKTCSLCGTVQPVRSSNVVGIGTGTRDMDYAKHSYVTSSVIRNNTIELTNRHLGISCKDCKNSVIENNILKPYGVAEGSGLFSGLFNGISVNGGTENMTVKDNNITATGRPSDGRAMFLTGISNLVATGNIITNRDTGNGIAVGATGIVHVSGFDGLKFNDNKITGIKNSVILETGTCFSDTGSGEFRNNTFESIPDTYVPWYTRRLNKVIFNLSENIFSKTSGALFHDNIGCAAGTPPSFAPARQYYIIDIKDSAISPSSIIVKNRVLTTIDVQKTNDKLPVFKAGDFKVTGSGYPPPPEGYQRFLFTPDKEGISTFSVDGGMSGEIVVLE